MNLSALLKINSASKISYTGKWVKNEPKSAKNELKSAKNEMKSAKNEIQSAKNEQKWDTLKADQGLNLLK